LKNQTPISEGLQFSLLILVLKNIRLINLFLTPR
jgi:hypothetical protein